MMFSKRLANSSRDRLDALSFLGQYDRRSIARPAKQRCGWTNRTPYPAKPRIGVGASCSCLTFLRLLTFLLTLQQAAQIDFRDSIGSLLKTFMELHPLAGTTCVRRS